jgi:hypothetical protein
MDGRSFPAMKVTSFVIREGAGPGQRLLEAA